MILQSILQHDLAILLRRLPGNPPCLEHYPNGRAKRLIPQLADLFPQNTTTAPVCRRSYCRRLVCVTRRPNDRDNVYVFEHTVRFNHGDGSVLPQSGLENRGIGVKPMDRVERSDLYKRGCFVMEAKQDSDADEAAGRPHL